MSRFCMYCGEPMNEADDMCLSCGRENSTGDNKGTTEKGSDSLKSKLLIIFIAVIAVVIAAIVLLLVFKSSYKEPVENLCEAMEDGDADDFYDALPPYVLEGLSDKKLRVTENNLKIAMMTLENECGEDIEVSYSIMEDNGVEKIDSDILEKMEKSIKKEYNESVSVSKGYSLTLKVNIEGDEQKLSSPYFCVNVYNIDGDWYVEDKEAAEKFVENASSSDIGSIPDLDDLINEKVQEFF